MLYQNKLYNYYMLLIVTISLTAPLQSNPLFSCITLCSTKKTSAVQEQMNNYIEKKDIQLSLTPCSTNLSLTSQDNHEISTGVYNKTLGHIVRLLTEEQIEQRVQQHQRKYPNYNPQHRIASMSIHPINDYHEEYYDFPATFEKRIKKTIK